MRVSPTLTLASALLMPAFPALAFDAHDTMNSIMVLFGLISFTVINLLIQLLFHFTGPYSKSDFVRAHVGVSILLPLVALVLALKNNVGGADLFFKLGGILVAIAFALLPLLLAKSAKPVGPNSSLMLGIAALVVVVSSLFIAPLGLVAAIIAAVALSYAHDTKSRLASVCGLILGASLMMYWTVQKLAPLVS